MNIITLNVYPIDVVGSAIYRASIPAPPRGIIRKAQIIQFFAVEGLADTGKAKSDKVKSGKGKVGGGGLAKPPLPVGSAFTATFYNSALACPPGNSGPVDPAIEAGGQIYFPLKTDGTSDRYLDADGNDGGFFPAGIPYSNNDPPIDQSDQVLHAPPGTLYLKLETTGTGAIVFGVFLMIDDIS
jgi:hypothetical protein